MHEAIKNPKIIALDYDGTLALNSYPQAGDPNWPVINKALAEQAAGAKLILWTCREGDELAIALDACASWGLHIAAVNDNLPEMQRFFGNNPRKIFGNEYWDDRAVNPTVDAVEVVHGEWTCDSEDGFENYDWHCSQCGGSIPYRCGNPKFTNYCPNCGAKMDGERKEK